MSSQGSVNWMAMLGGMVLVVGFFTGPWVIAAGAAMIVVGIFVATR